MSFRPLPLFTIFTIPLLVLLLWLGNWQYERADWKVGEIEAYQSRVAQDLLTIDDALCVSDRDKGSSVIGPEDELSEVARTVDSAVLRVYGFSTSGEPGWRRYMPVPAPSCMENSAPILAELAFESLKTGQKRAVSRLRLIEATPAKTVFTSENSPETNEWYWFDEAAMAQAFGVAKFNSQWRIVADDGLPDHLRRTPPERHIGYSVTWYGMAIVLFVMYAAFHMHVGRLRFGDAPKT